jgi:hypothetical protein
MNFRIFCIFSLFLLNIFIHGLVENSNIQVPDFRYTKTTCMAGVNDLRYSDINVSPYMQSKYCWIFQNNIQFSQPYLPYKYIVFLDIFIFSIGFFFF